MLAWSEAFAVGVTHTTVGNCPFAMSVSTFDGGATTSLENCELFCKWAIASGAFQSPGRSSTRSNASSDPSRR